MISSSLSKATNPRYRTKQNAFSTALFPPEHPGEAETIEKHHGRLETRKIWALRVDPEQIGFCGVNQVVQIQRHFLHLRSEKSSEETVLAITSLESLSDSTINGQKLLEIARGQCAIENGNHYVRDRSYDEDRCQVLDPNSARILSTLRSLARFLAKHNAHSPRNAHQATTPALHRYCNAHRNQAIHWLMSPPQSR